MKGIIGKNMNCNEILEYYGIKTINGQDDCGYDRGYFLEIECNKGDTHHSYYIESNTLDIKNIQIAIQDFFDEGLDYINGEWICNEYI